MSNGITFVVKTKNNTARLHLPLIAFVEVIMKTRRSKTPLSALSRISLSFLLSVSLPALQAVAQPGEEGPSAFKAMGVVIPPPAPDRSATEGEGPFDRLVIDNVMLVNGLGRTASRPSFYCGDGKHHRSNFELPTQA
jgi:hypothetical protein